MGWIFISEWDRGNKHSGNLISRMELCIFKMVLAKHRGIGNELTYVSTKLMDLLWVYTKKVSFGGKFSSLGNKRKRQLKSIWNCRAGEPWWSFGLREKPQDWALCKVEKISHHR